MRKEKKGKASATKLLARVLSCGPTLTRLTMQQARDCILRPGMGSLSPSLLSCLLGFLLLLLGGGLKLQCTSKMVKKKLGRLSDHKA